MSWKFSCESKERIPLPPEYTFPQAFNYLNPEGNSFYILENEKGYIQCAGSKQCCTVELREYIGGGRFKHYAFYDPSGSDEEVFIPMTKDGIVRQKKHCFGFLLASKLFKCFYEGKAWPKDIALEDISAEFV